MRWQIDTLYIGVLCVGLLFLLSCEPDRTCHQDMQATMIVTLRADSMDVQGNKHTYDAWDSLYVQGVGATDVLYNPKSIKQLGVCLRPDTTETAFLILYHGQVDTLTVTHTPSLHYVSLSCGCAVYHTITAARSSDERVDSVTIINASVETTAQENIRIYLSE